MKTKKNCVGLCQTLREKKNEIIEAWKKEIKEVLAVANDQPPLILVDHLSEIISNLSDILECAGQDHVDQDEIKKKSELSKAHGRQRASQTNYSLKEVLAEYIVLRGVIIDKLFSTEERTQEETKIVHKYIDEGIQNAVLEFVKIQHQQIDNGIVDLKQEKDLRETFVSALTHDLRTPITAARMSAQILRKNPQNIENVHKQISRIIANVDRIDSMIQDLLDANLLKAGQVLPVNRAEWNLKNVAEETLSDLEVSYGPRFVLNAPVNIYYNCSKDAVRRIIENLCSNAIKYGFPDTPITVTILENAEDVFINVQNFGSLIPQDEVDGLFGKYQRSPMAIASGQQGWGIGLTLVKGLVEAHEGSISVESNESVGTIFKIILPKIKKI
jgi:signal transduction histidine kinase